MAATKSNLTTIGSLKLGQRTWWETLYPVLPTISVATIISFGLLLFILWCERALGLPIWFSLFTMYMTVTANWPERGWWLVILGVVLAICYGLPFAVGLGVLILGSLLTIGSAEYVKSDTLRITFSTLMIVVIINWLLGGSWSWQLFLTHLLSLFLGIVFLRYFILRKGRLGQDSTRFASYSLLFKDKDES